MNITNSIRIAVRALTANKLRTSLTMLGMIIGVGAVIALMSVGKGAQASVTSQIQSMGSNLLFVTPGATSEGGVRTAQGSAVTLTLEDSDAIAAQIPEVVAVAPSVQSMGQIVSGGVNIMTRIMGVTPSYMDVRDFELAEGEFITAQQQETGASVAVLGSSVAEQLFEDASPIGQTVKVNQVSLRVIGVLKSKGGSGMDNIDDQIVVPLNTVQRKLSRGRTASGDISVSQISVQVTNDNQKTLDSAVQGIGELLRERHRKAQDDFTITSQKDTLAAATQVTGTFTLLLGAVAGISLVVGGIGIMNIMLVSVTERTREIGIRKAVGAKRRDVLLQFLVEATSVSIVGGALGIAIGTAVSEVIGKVGYNGSPLNTVVTPDAVLLAMGVSMGIGVFFGIYPAMRAASLRPIEALRYE